MSILRVSGLTADGKALLQLEQRVRVEPSNGPTSNLQVPTRTKPQVSPTNPGDIKGRVRDTYDTASHRLNMSRGGLMLRCAQSRLELDYAPVVSTIRRGMRPPVNDVQRLCPSEGEPCKREFVFTIRGPWYSPVAG